MSGFKRSLVAGVAFLLILNGCGGGDGAAPVGGGGTVSGTAGTGSPVVGGTVTITDSASTPLTRTATTNTDGTYTVGNVDDLTFPVRINVAFAEGGAVRTLRSIVVVEDEDGSTRANINPITDVIAGSIEGITNVTMLNAEITRLSAVLAAALANYGVPVDSNFIGGEYAANPADLVDNALDMVKVQLDGMGNNIVLQSTANPAIQQSIPVAGTQANQVAELPAPLDTDSASPSDIKALVDAFAVDIARGAALTGADLNDVFHIDFKDDDGFTQANFANAISTEADADGRELSVTGYKILRCFADAGIVTDKCTIRVTLNSPTMEGEDFGGVAGAVKTTDFLDLIAERREGESLKFAGGFFKPFSAEIKLFTSNTVSVVSNGTATVSQVIRTGLSINARVAGNGNPVEPEEIANANLQTIQLVRDNGLAPESIIMSVTRSLMGQCTGENNRLNIDPLNDTNCGNQSFGNEVGNAASDSAADLLTAVFIDNSQSENNFRVPNVRLVDPRAQASLTSFGTLDLTSLQNLTSFANGSASSVSITLTPPKGASFVCISDGSNNEDVCVYASRTITIPLVRLNRQSTYFVITRDAENNTFQRQYNLNSFPVDEA